MNNWDNVRLVPEFNEQGVACYRLDGGISNWKAQGLPLVKAR